MTLVRLRTGISRASAVQMNSRNENPTTFGLQQPWHGAFLFAAEPKAAAYAWPPVRGRSASPCLDTCWHSRHGGLRRSR